MEEIIDYRYLSISKFKYLPISILKKSEFLKSIIPSNVNYVLIEDILPLIFGISIADCYTTNISPNQYLEKDENLSSYSLYDNLNLIKFIFYKLELIIEDEFLDDFIDYSYLNIMLEITRLLLLPEDVILKIRKQIFRNLLVDDNYSKLKEFSKKYENSWIEFKTQIKKLMNYHYSSSSIFKKLNIFKNITYFDTNVPLFDEMVKYYSKQHSNETNVMDYNICINIVYGFLTEN